MGITPLLPVATAALGTVAAKAWEGISRAPSFLDTLRNASVGPDNSAKKVQGQVATSRQSDEDPLQVSSPGDESRRRLELLDADMMDFERLLRRRLTSRGIDTSAAIELKSDGRGGIVVASLHPDRAAIEQILADDWELGPAFQRIESSLLAEDVLQVGGGDRQRDLVLRLDATGLHPRLE